MTKKQITVAQYLVQRLYEMGVRHLFSIPGDYIVPFLEAIDHDGRIQRIGNTNEMEAGYAADGYARLSGVGAVAVTYGGGSRAASRCFARAQPGEEPARRRTDRQHRERRLDAALQG